MGGRKPPVVEIPDLGYLAHVVTSERELEEVAAAYLRLPYVVFDVETVAGRDVRVGPRNSDKPALDERTNRVLWLALAGPGRVDVIPMGHPSLPNAPAPPQLERWKVMEALRPAFFDPSRPKVGQNVRFDALSLSKYWGQIPPGPYVDLISQVHTLNENLRTYGLGDLAKRYLGFSYAKLAQGGTPMDALPFDAVARYVGLDAKLTQLLYTRMSALLAAKPRLEAVAALEHDVTEVLVWAKHYGVLVDRQALQALSVLLEGRLDKIESKVYSAAGHHFLVTSTQQRAKVLYEELHLPVHERTPKGAPSTSEKALRPLARKHAIVPLLLEHAELSKLQSTYADGLVTFIDEDGRIRCNLKQSGTVTGRLSSSEPNLQNVPRQSDGGTEARIRSMFLASPGHTLVVGDYANVEARFMAHFSGPTVKKSKLLYAFNHGIDLHLMTASGLFDVPIEEITKEQRHVGKCHPAGTLIHTSSGVVPIESLGTARGEEEWEALGYGLEAWDGERWQPVTQFYSDGVRPVFEIEARSEEHVRTPPKTGAKGGMRGFRVRVTEKHKVWTRRGWVPANELVIGKDQIRVGLGEGQRWPLSLQSVSVNAFAPRHGVTSQVARQEITEDWAYLLGVITGDGSLSSTSVRIVAGDADADLRRRYSEVVKSVGLGEPAWHRTQRAKGAIWEIGIGSTTLVRFLETVGVYAPLDERRIHPRGKGRKTLRVPPVVLRSPDFVAAAFLRGLFDTDGTASASGDEVSMCSKSLDLCKDVQALLVSLGIFAQLREKWNTKLQRSYWETVVPARWVGVFAEVVGFESERKMGRIAGRIGTKAPAEEWVTVQRFSYVADEPVFDVEVEDTHRVVADGLCVHQTANFLIMFGGSYQRLMESGGFSEKVAKRMHQSFHQTYPEISRWTETTLAMVRQMPHPYVETILGRRRRLPELKAPRDTYEGRKLVSYAERQAINAIIQGSAADVNKMAMVRAFRRIQRAGKLGSWKVLLTVHDEIVLEVPERDTDAGIAMLRESMEQVKVDLRCPLVADIASGPTWAAAK